MKYDTQTTSIDQDLQDRVIATLRNSGRHELLRLTIRTENRCVVLEGRVPTYYAKQMAQTLARNVNGVETVRNDIDVQRTLDSIRRPQGRST